MVHDFFQNQNQDIVLTVATCKITVNVPTMLIRMDTGQWTMNMYAYLYYKYVVTVHVFEKESQSTVCKYDRSCYCPVKMAVWTRQKG